MPRFSVPPVSKFQAFPNLNPRRGTGNGGPGKFLGTTIGTVNIWAEVLKTGQFPAKIR